LNEITPYLDGGLFYGISKQWADQLRTYENGTIDPDGRLAYSHDKLFPAYNKERLPMANPPPPFYHSMFVKSHETLPVSRFFSKSSFHILVRKLPNRFQNLETHVVTKIPFCLLLASCGSDGTIFLPNE
jgi:hypothetical protein